MSHITSSQVHTLTLSQLYGESVIRPNHHYAMDVPDCLRDYGPMVGFWTFLFERLNKILKSYNSSNHSGGELEVSFFREFHRTILHSRMVRIFIAHNKTQYSDLALQMDRAKLSENAHIRISVRAMQGAFQDERGTVRSLAREVKEQSQDGMHNNVPSL
jgi:hypothetical protein